MLGMATVEIYALFRWIRRLGGYNVCHIDPKTYHVTGLVEHRFALLADQRRTVIPVARPTFVVPSFDVDAEIRGLDFSGRDWFGWHPAHKPLEIMSKIIHRLRI